MHYIFVCRKEESVRERECLCKSKIIESEREREREEMRERLRERERERERRDERKIARERAKYESSEQLEATSLE